MPKVKEYDCQKCGACCGFFCSAPKLGRAVVNTPLSERDLSRMSKKLRRKLVQIENSDYDGNRKTEMRLPARKVGDGAVCKFFKGEIGKKCGCSIYEDRPFNCRYFTPDIDNPSCRMARSAYGIEKKVRWLEHYKVAGATESQKKALEPYFLKEERKAEVKKGPGLLLGGARIGRPFKEDAKMEVGMLTGTPSIEM